MKHTTSITPNLSGLELRLTKLMGKLNRNGLYTLRMRINNSTYDLCELKPSQHDTAVPNWGMFSLVIHPGSHTLVMEVHETVSSLRSSTTDLVGTAVVSIHELFSEVPLPFHLTPPGRDTPNPGLGSLFICADIALDLPPNASKLPPGAMHVPADAAKDPSVRTLKTVLDALQRTETLYKGDKSLSQSIKSGSAFAQAALAHLIDLPAARPPRVEKEDFNVVWDLSRNLEQHWGFFVGTFAGSAALPKNTKAGLTRELLAATAQALAIIFGFVNTYARATYGYVGGVYISLQRAAENLVFRLFALDARMRGIPAPSTSGAQTEPGFYIHLAGCLADHYKNIKAPSGTWYELLKCARGTLAIKMLDGYKAYIDALSRKSDPANALLRRTARRLLAMLAYATMMLPSALVIPDSMFGKADKPPERTKSIIVDGQQVVPGGYAFVSFRRMRCPRRRAEISVAVKKIYKAVTPEAIRRTYLEILNGWTLHHPRILTTEGISYASENGCRILLVVSEKMEGGSLDKYICAASKFTRRTPEQKTRILNLWLKQVAEAMKYMHDEGIAHGDLHPGNIFLNMGMDGTDSNVVVGDFGLSIYLDSASNQFESTRSGAKRYNAPEQLILDDATAKKNGLPKTLISPSRRPTEQSDLFSWAMLCVQLYTQEKPFPNVHENLVGIEIMEGRRPSPLPQALTAQPVLYSCMKRCWSQKSSDRGDTAQMLADMRRVAPYDRA